MKPVSVLLLMTLLSGCAGTGQSYSRGDIINALQMISAARGDRSDWPAALAIEDRSCSGPGARNVVRSALRSRWCKTPQAASRPAAQPAAIAPRPDNEKAAQLAAETPDIRG